MLRPLLEEREKERVRGVDSYFHIGSGAVVFGAELVRGSYERGVGASLEGRNFRVKKRPAKTHRAKGMCNGFDYGRK